MGYAVLTLPNGVCVEGPNEEKIAVFSTIEDAADFAEDFLSAYQIVRVSLEPNV